MNNSYCTWATPNAHFPLPIVPRSVARYPWATKVASDPGGDVVRGAVAPPRFCLMENVGLSSTIFFYLSRFDVWWKSMSKIITYKFESLTDPHSVLCLLDEWFKKMSRRLNVSLTTISNMPRFRFLLTSYYGLGMSVFKSPSHAQKPSSGEWKRTLLIPCNTQSPPSHIIIYVHHLFSSKDCNVLPFCKYT